MLHDKVVRLTRERMFFFLYTQQLPNNTEQQQQVCLDWTSFLHTLITENGNSERCLRTRSIPDNVFVTSSVVYSILPLVSAEWLLPLGLRSSGILLPLIYGRVSEWLWFPQGEKKTIAVTELSKMLRFLSHNDGRRYFYWAFAGKWGLNNKPFTIPISSNL